jgi:hypothetical protein
VQGFISPKMAMNQEYKGSCKCGAVKFTAKACTPMLNAFCHCKLCSRGVGASPVHLYAIPNDAFSLDEGEVHVKKSMDGDKFCKAFCGECGTPGKRKPLLLSKVLLAAEQRLDLTC